MVDDKSAEERPEVAPDPFAAVARDARAMGGFLRDLPHHVVAFLPGRGARLVVSFDNLASGRETERRYPWGYEFLRAQGYGVLGVMGRRNDWFRDAALWDVFDEFSASGFFAGFDHVAMYGSSMGGYGALAFAPAAPGCTVVAFSPQSTLAPDLVPFETRYRHGRRLGAWTGRYLDGAAGVGAARRAYVAYDPKQPPDAAHAARLAGPNVTFLPMPWLGHKLPPALRRMGALKEIALPALEGRLEPEAFRQIFRLRRQSLPWLAGLFERARERGHARLALPAAEALQAARPHWRINQQVRAMRAELSGRVTPRPGDLFSSGSDPT